MAWRKLESLKEHQKILLEALSAFDEVCKSNGINYSLAYGTMLGAVRHKGFIPWDDDVDVLMLRSDYEKFERVFGESEFKERYKLWGIHDKENYFVGYAGKFFDKRTRLIERLKRKVVYGVYVDIFIVDELPESEAKSKVFLTLYRYLSRLLQIFSRRAALFDGIRRWVRVAPDFYTIRKCVEALLRKKGGGDYAVTTCIAGWDFEKVLLSRESIGNYELIEFEGRQFKVFSGWDEILKKWYGEYWVLPPEEQRYSHPFEIYVEE